MGTCVDFYSCLHYIHDSIHQPLSFTFYGTIAFSDVFLCNQAQSKKCILLVNINMTKMYVNCGSCSIQAVYCTDRLAMRMPDERHRVLKNAFAASSVWKKKTFMRLVRRLYINQDVLVKLYIFLPVINKWIGVCSIDKWTLVLFSKGIYLTPNILTLILPTCFDQNVWTVLGELVVRQTSTPTRDHLPNSP